MDQTFTSIDLMICVYVEVCEVFELKDECESIHVIIHTTLPVSYNVNIFNMGIQPQSPTNSIWHSTYPIWCRGAHTSDIPKYELGSFLERSVTMPFQIVAYSSKSKLCTHGNTPQFICTGTAQIKYIEQNTLKKLNPKVIICYLVMNKTSHL